MTASFDPSLTAEVNSALGPLFGVPIAAPAALERSVAAGFDADDRLAWYYAFRSAPMGRASAETVVATYFNFPPERIRRYIPRVWDIAEPDQVIELLMEIVDEVMGEALAGLDGPALRELADLVSAAAAAAFECPEGRPLFAGIAAIPWPDAPGAQVWLGMHALREFRGDGHVAVLTQEGLSALEALVLHGAMGLFSADMLRKSRGWARDDWDVTVDDLRARGLLQPDEVALSDKGREYRYGIERRTDELAVPAFTGIGEAGARRIVDLAPPVLEAVEQHVGPLVRVRARPADD